MSNRERTVEGAKEVVEVCQRFKGTKPSQFGRERFRNVLRIGLSTMFGTVSDLRRLGLNNADIRAAFKGNAVPDMRDSTRDLIVDEFQTRAQLILAAA